MTDEHDPRPGRDWDNDRDHGTDRDWGTDRDRHASLPAGSGPSEDIRQLSYGEERDLHFNGYLPYDMQPLHELCYPGGCQYKTEAENCADLENWYASADLTAEDDPEAEL